MRAVLALGLTLVFFAPDGAREGRRGNARLAENDTTGAEAAFREGLARSVDARPGTSAGDVRASLWNGLGLALYARGRFAEAAAAFDSATVLAPHAERRARFAYNAGTALARADSLDAALVRLRRALIIRPEGDDARFNYELVRRRLVRDAPEEPPPPGDAPPPVPSPFARRLKARADSLVAARQYRPARDVLRDGLARDSTVAAYAEAIRRLETVVAIEDSVDAAPPAR